jgi:hypothetical protein
MTSKQCGASLRRAAEIPANLGLTNGVANSIAHSSCERRRTATVTASTAAYRRIRNNRRASHGVGNTAKQVFRVKRRPILARSVAWLGRSGFGAMILA